MPLSPEEKKARKAEKKAQKLRAAEEFRIKVRKDELTREVKNSASSVEENMKRWYLANYAARFPFIKQDMEVAWHMFEHCLDMKEFVIEELTDRMEEAKIQEAMTWQDTTLKIDRLIADFEQRVHLAEQEFKTNKKDMLIKAQNDGLALEVSHVQLEEYLKTVRFIMEQQFHEASTLTQGENMTKQDEEAKKGQHAIELMSGALEKNIQSTVGCLRNTMKDYRESTDSLRKKVEALKQKDEFYMGMIKRQETKMTKLLDEVITLQGQVSARYESRMALDDLKKDREETYTEYTEMRARLSREAIQDEQQLETLSTESNSVMQDLTRIFDKGEKILRMASLCRKLETQEEKVLPFGTPLDLPEEPQSEECQSALELFWRRYANANLIKRKLEPTLDSLKAENRELRRSLEIILDEMSVGQPI